MPPKCQFVTLILLIINQGDSAILEIGDLDDECDLPQKIENGNRVEKEHNRARYQCHDDSTLPKSIIRNDNWVSCDDEKLVPESPYCTETKLKRIGTFPKTVLEVKQMLSHGPMKTKQIGKN